MNRRAFLRSALVATASGLLVPEWILDPPKGRSMVAVPGFHGATCIVDFVAFGDPEYIKVTYDDGRVETYVTNELAIAS